MDRLFSMRVFATIAEMGSFAGAAQGLPLQPHAFKGDLEQGRPLNSRCESRRSYLR
jgi:hypothetical protein